MGAWAILLLFVLFAAGVPVTFALGLAAVGMLLFQDVPMVALAQQMYGGVDSFPLMAVPFFILAGELMTGGGISRRLVAFAQALVGHVRGGLAHVCTVSSMFFAGVSGSGIADTAAVGALTIPAMVEKGYGRPFAASLAACAGSIGPVIPPSIPMVVFGVIGSVSVAKLFMGGAIPGVLMGISLMVLTHIIAKRRGYIGTGKFSWRLVAQTARDASLALVMPLIIVGGIMSGLFTATESGVVAVVYALLVGRFVYGELRWGAIGRHFIEAAVVSGTILLVISTASLFTWLITNEQVPQRVSTYLIGLTRNPWMMLALINVLLLIVGTFIDTLSALIIFSPLFLPVTQALGINPVHFGLVVVVNLTIGMCTPPLGVCLFVASGIAKVSLREMLVDLWPMLIALIVVLAIVTYVPQSVMFLPNLLVK